MVSKGKYYCSFCGKDNNEVKQLIAGPQVFICDECIDLCKDIVDERKRQHDQKPVLFPDR